MVATIHSLPLELVRPIITAAACSPPRNPAQVYTTRLQHRYRLLRATADVCSAWTTISQELLWEDVRLASSASRGAFVTDPRYFSRCVDISCFGWEAYTRFEIPGRTVLEGLSGVEELSIGGWRVGHSGTDERFKLDFISGAGFRDLKCLSLLGVALRSDPPLTTLPFALANLKIHPFTYSEHDSEARLFGTLCQPSITSLDITHDYLFKSILPEFLPAAPQLITLRLECGVESDWDPVTFFRACTSLGHLTTLRMAPESINHLPVALVSWNLEHFDKDDAVPLISVIGGDAIGLSKLKAGNSESSFRGSHAAG